MSECCSLFLRTFLLSHRLICLPLESMKNTVIFYYIFCRQIYPQYNKHITVSLKKNLLQKYAHTPKNLTKNFITTASHTFDICIYNNTKNHQHVHHHKGMFLRFLSSVFSLSTKFVRKGVIFFIIFLPVCASFSVFFLSCIAVWAATDI